MDEMEDRSVMTRSEFVQAMLREQERKQLEQKKEINRKYEERRKQRYGQADLYTIDCIKKMKSGSCRRRRKMRSVE